MIVIYVAVAWVIRFVANVDVRAHKPKPLTSTAAPVNMRGFLAA